MEFTVPTSFQAVLNRALVHECKSAPVTVIGKHERCVFLEEFRKTILSLPGTGHRGSTFPWGAFPQEVTCSQLSTPILRNGP